MQFALYFAHLHVTTVLERRVLRLICTTNEENKKRVQENGGE